MSEQALEVHVDHGPPCTLGSDGGPCVRCAGFEQANGHGLRHGAYARLRLSEAAGKTADQLRDHLPIAASADEPLLQLFAFTYEQVRCAGQALEGAAADKRAELAELRKDARAWARVALTYAEAFGMSPRSRAKLGLDLAHAAVLKRSFDLDRLTPEQRVRARELAEELEALVADAEVVE